jgi:uncharacterized membrane protein
MTNSAPIVGLFAGLFLALGILVDGFFGFVLMALFGGVGLVVGRIADGEIDVSQYLTRGRSR